MDAVHTAGEPPKIGRIIFAAIGWIKKRRVEPKKVASEKTTRLKFTVLVYLFIRFDHLFHGF
jgi:hypothetical protein